MMTDSKVDLQDIIHDLEEAQGFAAMSPVGRDNIASAISGLEDAAETTYRNGFVDGEKHASENASVHAAFGGCVGMSSSTGHGHPLTITFADEASATRFHTFVAEQITLNTTTD
jgi:hypothetical protein